MVPVQLSSGELQVAGLQFEVTFNSNIFQITPVLGPGGVSKTIANTVNGEPRMDVVLSGGWTKFRSKMGRWWD